MSDFAPYAEIDEYWPKERSTEVDELLHKVTSRKFHDMMDDRMLVSHYKYGDSRLGYPEKSVAVDNVKVRIDKYLETGNVEYLIDAANFCMLEFMHPHIKNAFLKATDSDGSPGILYKDLELRQEKHKDINLLD